MQGTIGVVRGNAAEDGNGWRGWLVGHFLPGAEDPRATGDVEVKWAVYAGGETRAAWGVNDRAHTLAILVRGRFRLTFPDGDALLSDEGDYVLWEPGVPHRWRAETAAVVVTVRWPSLPDDSRDVDEGVRVTG